MSEPQPDPQAAADRRLAQIETWVREVGAIVYAVPEWLRPNYTEPQVLFGLRDLIRPGQTAFDVGANFGNLSIAMSRRAGPRGALCAFEANPEIAMRCQRALLRSGCGNAQVFSAAIFHTSRQRLPLYLSDNMVGDSVTRRVSDRSIEVGTIALDDFVAETGLVPDFVKMDIEGAEFDALSGFVRTIEQYQPTMILEQQPDDDRCFRLLREHGYAAIDLRVYEPIEDFSDLPLQRPVLDVLYARPPVLAGTPYAAPIAKVIEYELGPGLFSWTGAQTYETVQPIDLGVGRYLIRLDFSVETAAELRCGVTIGAAPIIQYHGEAGWLSRAACDWVVAVDNAGPASLFFHFPHQSDPSLRVASAKIFRMPGFDGKTPLFG